MFGGDKLSIATYYWLYFLENASAVEKADSESSYEST